VVAEDGAGNKSTPSSSVSATTLTAPTLATVEGVISSSSTNTPLANALVFTGDLATTHGSVSSTTNSSGQYLLSGIKPTSQHNYYYSASGYLKQSIYVGYPAGINIKNVTLNP
jgi:hypothetical protein